jgi:hypothetical protein
MKGTIVILQPTKALPLAIEMDRPADLEILKKAIGGGYLELVPRFTSFVWEGELQTCVAFCDEDGKRKGMLTNNRATLAWEQALRRTGHPGLLDAFGRAVDWLVGDIAIVFGDSEFMETL